MGICQIYFSVAFFINKIKFTFLYYLLTQFFELLKTVKSHELPFALMST